MDDEDDDIDEEDDEDKKGEEEGDSSTKTKWRINPHSTVNAYTRREQRKVYTYGGFHCSRNTKYNQRNAYSCVSIGLALSQEPRQVLFKVQIQPSFGGRH